MIAYPMFYPLVALKYEINGSLVGLVLCTPALTSLIMIPIINRYVLSIGIERTIFFAGLMLGFAFITSGLAVLANKDSVFLGISFASSFLVGLSTACNIVGEQGLLLRYSLKSESEKNLGMFRAAIGIGGLMAPLVSASMSAWGGFMAAFIFIGIGYLLICPFIYKKLYSAREEFMKAKRDAEMEEEHLNLLLNEDGIINQTLEDK